MNQEIILENQYSARNYAPFPVVLSRGEGVYVWDKTGRRYLDMMSGYSAVSLGHSHPRLISVLQSQAGKLAMVSRVYYNDRLGPFLEKLCKTTGMDRALPMNSGAEAVETALKAARKWAYEVKGVPADQAEIVVCQGNFHGRTIAVIGFSSEQGYKNNFGPFAPGFKLIPYGDPNALKRAINKNTAGFLVEPIQGEGGIIVPPPGYLKQCAEICRDQDVLLLCDEIQTGLGRTGKLLACDHENVKPDGLILGKALGGGLLPVSAFLAKREVMEVFTPGSHGSTFGGNPLAAAVGLEVLDLIEEEKLSERAALLGDYLLKELLGIRSPLIISVRGKGLLTGVEIDTEHISGRDFCLLLLERGILSKETHDTVIRFAPPLVINQQQLEWAIDQIKQTFLAAECCLLERAVIH